MLTAVLALVGNLFYVLVYTRWLKRSTPQNIVIGGAAGAVPPLVGWAAATGNLTLPALFLFLIVFFWTPPHFWALALLIKRDYEAARIPMLPVVRGDRETARQIVLYSLVLVAVTLLPFAWRHVRASLYLVGGAAARRRVPVARVAAAAGDDAGARAALLFHYSLLYLALLFVAMAVDPLIVTDARSHGSSSAKNLLFGLALFGVFLFLLRRHGRGRVRLPRPRLTAAAPAPRRHLASP